MTVSRFISKRVYEFGVLNENRFMMATYVHSSFDALIMIVAINWNEPLDDIDCEREFMLSEQTFPL
jgi:hypothetical protein